MNRTVSVIRSPRAGVVLVLMSVGWVVSAQQTAAPRPPTPVTTNFTGSVANLNATDISAVRFRYAAGARSYWHSHAGIQVLTLEEGRWTGAGSESDDAGAAARPTGPTAGRRAALARSRTGPGARPDRHHARRRDMDGTGQ